MIIKLRNTFRTIKTNENGLQKLVYEVKFVVNLFRKKIYN